jgi:hypothetical protein
LLWNFLNSEQRSPPLGEILDAFTTSLRFITNAFQELDWEKSGKDEFLQ